MIDASALQMLLMVLTAWLERREREALAYLIEENRLLRRQLGGRRLRLTDDDRRRLAVRAYRLGRRALHPGHVTPLAPPARRPEMDLRDVPIESARRAGRNSAPGRADGE